MQATELTPAWNPRVLESSPEYPERIMMLRTLVTYRDCSCDRRFESKDNPQDPTDRTEVIHHSQCKATFWQDYSPADSRPKHLDQTKRIDGYIVLDPRGWQPKNSRHQLWKEALWVFHALTQIGNKQATNELDDGRPILFGPMPSLLAFGTLDDVRERNKIQLYWWQHKEGDQMPEQYFKHRVRYSR